MILDIFSYNFMQNALLICITGGSLVAFLGIFVHLKRVVFLGNALPQIIGIGIAMSVFFNLPIKLGAILGGILGVSLLSFSGKNKLPYESYLGISYALGISLTAIIISSSTNKDIDIVRFFTGDILATNKFDIYLVLLVSVAVIIFFKLYWSKIIISSLDSLMSSTLGIKTWFWNFSFFMFLSISIAVLMYTLGAMLTFSLLVAPSALSLILFRKFSYIIISTIIISILSSFAGLIVSYNYDLPSGPSIASLTVLLFLLTLIIKKLAQFIKINHSSFVKYFKK